MADFKNGTLFAKIIEINNQMTEKLETKVDLRTENCNPAEKNSQSEEGQLKKMQDRLDKYI